MMLKRIRHNIVEIKSARKVNTILGAQMIYSPQVGRGWHSALVIYLLVKLK